MGSVDIYPPSQPSGMALAYAEVTTGQTTITTETDLTNLTVTVTVPAGRRIRVVGRIAANGTVASSTPAMNIKEGATVLHNIQIQNSTTPGNGTTLEGDVILLPTAGTHTYKLSLQLAAGTGSVGMAAGATFPAYILVEDITGTIYPAGTLVTAGIIASEQWTSWVPTWTAMTVGNGVLDYAKYIKFGRLINFRIKFTFGTTSAMGTTPHFTLPFSAAADYVQEHPVGLITMIDSGVKAWNGTLQIFSATDVLLRGDDGAGAFQTVSSTSPFTWGTSDYFMLSGSYEAVV